MRVVCLASPGEERVAIDGLTVDCLEVGNPSRGEPASKEGLFGIVGTIARESQIFISAALTLIFLLETNKSTAAL